MAMSEPDRYAQNPSVAEWIAPSIQQLIQLLRGFACQAAQHLDAAQFLHDGIHFACRGSLHMHFSQAIVRARSLRGGIQSQS